MLRLSLLLFAVTARAHVGSPDIFLEGKAGPYPVFVSVRPPTVIPGVAEVDIRVRAGDVRQIKVAPTPVQGPGARLAPTPDIAVRSKDDPQFYTGSLWLMTSGSWQVKVIVDGAEGTGELGVPVPALANRTEGMGTGLGAILAALTILLSVGAVSLVGAAFREARLEPGVAAGPPERFQARRAMAVVACLVAAILYFGNNWWNDEAANYSRIIYQPLQMAGKVSDGNLHLTLSDPGWLGRQVDDFVPDHNHLMHLFVIRLPEMERVWHLHPEMTAPGQFTHRLPAMPAGKYALYADVVHQSGLPETMVTEIELPQIAGAPLAGDDSAGVGTAVRQADFKRDVFELPDGTAMTFLREIPVYPLRKPHAFRFRVAAKDLELYMGMPGHAAFVKHDRTVFAHVHPTGSVPMAALQLTQPDPHAGHNMSGALPDVVSFPYGFPQPGDYRVFVQIKRAGAVQTGFFDVRVK